MVEAAFAIPGDILTPSGGYAYDREVLRRLHDHGVSARHLALPGAFPEPSPADVEETLRRLAEVPEHFVVLFDGLAYGALPVEAIGRIRQPIVALVHHPLWLETGLSPERAADLKASETEALEKAVAVIVTSHATMTLLARDFGIPRDRIDVAEPGTQVAQRASGGGGGTVAILAVGAVVPRKGYDVLVEALTPLAHLDWQLTIAGAEDRGGSYATAIQRQIREGGLAGRISLAGAVSDEALNALYGKADLFVHASHFEGFGMVLTEALARGLPIVATRGGAAADTVSDSAARKVPPGDAPALREALAGLLTDPSARRMLSDAAWREAQALPHWDDTARIVARVLKRAGS